jgi:crotonobetainyl-CoA:carnitine CoA-transferase CaiB-like acyl-CoA transferase
MAGVLSGIAVLDLSRGVAGPMTTMLLADHGASVTRIEPPSGDPFAGLSGYQVWQRGKRNAQLDLHDPADRETLYRLVDGADVLVENFKPGTTARLGISYDDVRDRNPGLVYCSITGYGTSGPLADRPGYDALVAARTGQQWEARGIPGGTLNRLAGHDDEHGGLEVPEDCWVGSPRPGPLFGGLPWVSLGACYLATLGISAALRVRELTGRGQRVHTSLLQGALATTVWPWQRVERVDAPGFRSWVIDPRAPKGFFRAADGRWIHQWVPLPSFVLDAAASGTLDANGDLPSPRDAPFRIGLDPDDMVLLHHYVPRMAEAIGGFPADDWVAAAARADVPLQPVRSPEEALDDPLYLADGAVVELPRSDGAPIRQVGRVYSLSACPTDVAAGVAVPGQHTDEVRAEATRIAAMTPHPPHRGEHAVSAPAAPLDRVVVLDLGLAAAGPFGAQLLADLGADVIKVNQATDRYWMSNHIGMACNRGKRSIAVDLKTAQGRAILHRLAARADVVHHNMRYEAAERLGVDYEALRSHNPRLIYCHTRGFERGPRDGLPGNDQTAASLCGAEWLDGGLDDGGRPIWGVTSLGDTGNGLLSAIAVVQALMHRDRTGEGQYVDTSITYAHLLNASFAWKAADGSAAGDRPRLDAMQYGWGALYRLYPTGGGGWICIAAVTEAHWWQLCAAIGRPELATDRRFAFSAVRRDNEKALAAVLEPVFAAERAEEWFSRLDGAGVPCEVTHEDRVRELFDDPTLRANRWIATYEHPVVGRTEVAGLLVDLSETPGRLSRPAPVVGQHTCEILGELGYDDAVIDELVRAGVVTDPDREQAPLPEELPS